MMTFLYDRSEDPCKKGLRKNGIDIRNKFFHDLNGLNERPFFISICGNLGTRGLRPLVSRSLPRMLMKNGISFKP